MKDGNRKPAVFLDRDGVLTEEKGYVTSVKDLQVFPYAAECVRQIHRKGYYAIVVTNQSGVAKGLFTEKALQEMNHWLMGQTKVDAVYYCPHHPEGVVMKYRKPCRCRKQGTGMFEAACRDFNINMQQSYMVGDRASDILAGENAGVRTVLLESGYGIEKLEENVAPNHIFNDLRDFVQML